MTKILYNWESDKPVGTANKTYMTIFKPFVEIDCLAQDNRTNDIMLTHLVLKSQ